MDDLLDLNWSSSPTTSSSKPLAPSLQPSKPKPTGSAATSSFDFLAKSNTGSASRTGTPNYYQSSTPRTTTPLAAPVQAAPLPKPQATSTGTGGDAFSSLLGMGSSLGSKNLTMAQKQAQMIEERRLKEERERAQFAGLGNWEQFGTTSNSSSSSTMSAPLQPIPTKSLDAFNGLLQPTISRPSSSTPSRGNTPAPAKSVGKGTFWDNQDFLAGPSKPSPPPKPSPLSNPSASQAADPWDFDQLAAVEPVRPNGNGKTSGMRTPDPDFDFGEWRDMDGPGQSSRSSQSRAPEREVRREPKARSSSPPPHIVGQIVEMGFSPAQARAALAKTSTGIDVQAALEGLLGEAFGSREPADELEEDDDYVERERIRRETEEKEERRRRRRQGPSRDTIAPRSRDERERENERSQAGTPIQADQILAQATEIGQSVFTKATSLWNVGKEKALKAYEEQKKVYEAQLAAGGGKERGKGPVKDGRPRWMVEAEAEARSEREEIGGAGAGLEKESGFRDDSDEEEDVPRPKARTNGNGASSSRPSRGPDRQAQAVQETSLFGDDPLPPRPTQRRPEVARSRPNPPLSKPTPAARTRTPPAPLPARTLIPADPSTLSSSSNHKTKGNEHFKLGRFTEAESSYSTAISILPDGHLHLIPLYNNRAATRIKLGESSGAAQDSTTVIEIIGLSYHPSKEAPLPPTYADIKLADAFVKAHTKRAQAWEMAEKWNKAVEDWEKILGFDGAMLGGQALQTRNLAAEGLRRSKQMLDGPTPSASTSKPKAAPKPVPKQISKPAQVERSEAVSTLRAAARVQEQEDQQRLALKDSTELRINTWKQGKETNLRALLASLDTVLWDEVLAGGLKVGMHELITEKQVKIKYMKVIARLHPDKLDVKKTTVEQRMLANGAFGTLNEAWQAFNNA